MKKTFFKNKFLPHTSQYGFTLVETIVAIFILALTIGGLLSLTAGGFFAIRYAKNDIVATNLLQESLEYIRNSRDSASQNGSSWDMWYQQFQTNNCDITTNNNNNNNNQGCMINPYAASIGDPTVSSCASNGCLNLNYYPTSGFYGYRTNKYFLSLDGVIVTSFVRTITFKLVTPPGSSAPELIVTAKMSWKNGSYPKQIEQSIILSKWNLQ